MSTWIAALLAIAAITATYLFCVRPTMRGRRMTSGLAAPDVETDRQLAELSEELRMLRAQDSLNSGPAPISKPTPPADH